MNNNNITIIGAGAHARKVWNYTKLLGWSVSAFVDDNPQATSPSSSIPCLSVQAAKNCQSAQRYVVAIGNAVSRRRLQEEFEGIGWQPITLIHPTAYVAPDVTLGEGSVVCAQAVVETGSVIGRGTIIDVGSIVDHDCIVGAFCHLKTGCILQPYTSVGDGEILNGRT